LAKLIASELRVLLIQPSQSAIADSPSNGDGPACDVCGRPAQPGRRVCRRCRKVAGREREREQQARQAEQEAVRNGKRGPRAAELANGVRADPAKPDLGAVSP
jgi:predicted amidophosphoribosyltransferase